MDFNKRKITVLAAMDSTEHDKSPKGTIDSQILPLLNTLNSHPSYFTTSSCSGRISIFAQSTKKSKGGSWLFISHESVDPNSIVSLIFPFDSSHLSTQNSNLVFRFEPLIIAMECLDVDSAQSLVSIAISCGLRESGITTVRKRVIVAIRSSLRLEVPLGNTDSIMVSEEFIRYIVGIANEKMDANRRRSDELLRALQSSGFMDAECGDESNGLLNLALDDNSSSKWNRGHDCLDIQNNQSHVQKEEDDTSYGANWVLQIGRDLAKLAKDVLKQFGWLDLGKKAYSPGGGQHICFPVTKCFCSLFLDKQNSLENAYESLNVHLLEPLTREGFSVNKLSSSTALNLLNRCAVLKVPDCSVQFRKARKSPFKLMRDSVASLLMAKGLPELLLEQLPTRWDRLGDVFILPATSFKDPVWDSIGEEIWLTVAKSLNARRLARQGRVAPNCTRDSTLEILVGDNGWIDHRENGIFYSFDATKCIFSWGNLSEKLRMSSLDCRNEIVVDLFAGIGYFTLPFLVRAKALLVYACEWNPHAINALKCNVRANSVADRCVILEGDNRLIAPKRVANRVCLGLLPTSEDSWFIAIQALSAEGGILHVHGNVKDVEEESWTHHVSNSVAHIAKSEGHQWEVSVEHVERVKWYAPHIRHLVADVRCQRIKDV